MNIPIQIFLKEAAKATAELLTRVLPSMTQS